MKKYFFCFSLILFFSCNSKEQNINDDLGNVEEKEKFYVNPILKPGSYNNEKINSIADPFVFKDESGTYYLYFTGKGFGVFSSQDLINWNYRGKCFQGEGVKWAKFNFWAPEMLKYNGKYYLHYTASEREDSPKRIGLAVSDSPIGPFVDISNKPFYQHEVDKGCIDSHIFIDDDGSIYMYYSNAMSTNYFEPNKQRSEIWGVKLKNDLSGIEGEPVCLFYPTQDWEYDSNKKQFWNEAPEMIKYRDTYYLMYSANNYASSNYAIGYATSSSPLGTYEKYTFNPILSNKGIENFVSGPGHHSITESPDGTELICVYHSHFDIEQKGGIRMVNIDRMGFDDDGTLYVDGPSYTKKLVPSSSKNQN